MLRVMPEYRQDREAEVQESNRVVRVSCVETHNDHLTNVILPLIVILAILASRLSSLGFFSGDSGTSARDLGAEMGEACGEGTGSFA